MAVTRRFLGGMAAVLALTVGLAASASMTAPDASAASAGSGHTGSALGRAVAQIVRYADGPPGIAVLVQRGGQTVLYRAGTADLARGAPIRMLDSMRLASVAKAFSGAVALSLVAGGVLSFGDTVGKWLPGLPPAWSKVTLRELLNHTSGIPDFTKTVAFARALGKSPLRAPRPRALLSFAGKRLNFTPGSEYGYSNSDNIIVGLMVEAATGKSYVRELRERVLMPLRLRARASRAEPRCPSRSCTAMTWPRRLPPLTSPTCSRPDGRGRLAGSSRRCMMPTHSSGRMCAAPP